MERYSGFHHACSALSGAPLLSARKLRTGSENQFHLFFLSYEEAGWCGCQESLCKNNLFHRSSMLYLFNLRSHMLSLLPIGGEKNREKQG